MRKPGNIVLGLAVLGLIAFFAVVVFDLFGDDGDDARQFDEARWCQLATDLDRVAQATGAASASGIYDGPPERIQTAAVQMGSTLAELKRLAPGPVRGPAGVVADTLMQAASGRTVTADARFAESAQRVNNYRAASCATGAGSGEG